MKTALVTGTSSGLGQQIALDLLENGWRVIGFSRSESLKLMSKDNFTQKIVDITNLDELIRVFEDIVSLDCVIHNAAVFKLDNFENTSFEEINKIINTNLLAPINISKLSIKILKPGSRVFFINSVAGIYEFPGQSIYCASKHGLKAFSSIISKELKEKNIKTISIHPGGIDTPLWEKTSYPLGDVQKALKPDDISKTILHILNSPNYIEFKTIEMFPEIESH